MTRSLPSRQRIWLSIPRWGEPSSACALTGNEPGPIGLGNEQFQEAFSLDLAGLVAGELFGKRAEVEDRLVPRAEHDDHALGGLDQVAEDRIAPVLGQCQPPLLDQPFRPDPEGVRVDWLENVVDGALAEGFDGSLEVGVGRDDHHGRVGCSLAQARQEVEGIAVGQPPVQDDDLVLGERGERQGLAHRAGRLDRVVIHLQDIAQVLPGVGIILDHQDASSDPSVFHRVEHHGRGSVRDSRIRAPILR